MVLYEYVGKMLRKEGKIVVENVKKLMRKAMGIVLSVVLTLGCILGSGTIAWAEGETADAAAKIKVACVGDSLTEGYTSTGANSGKKGPNAYPARLQSLLGSGYEVKNFGETGAFLMEGTSNPYKSGTEYEQSKAYNADIVIIMLGTNDSKNWNEENYKTQMTAFYNEYKTENNKVIFATSPKCYQTTGNDITQEKVEKVYQAQKALIKENAAWDFIDMYEKTEGKENLYNTDKVHFTDAGYLYIAECMYEKITGKKAPIEEKVKIPHTQQSGETNYFTFAEGKWEAGDAQHTWSKKVDPAHPEATYYEVKFTGHKIDIYSGKNRMMGKVKYLIDGEEKAEGDLYNATNINSTFITTISDLEEKEHTLKAVATGERNASGTGSDILIDAAEVYVYTYREPEEAKLHGTITDNNLQYTQDKLTEVKAANKTEDTLNAWKNDTVTSEISLASIDSSYTDVTATASDFTGNGNTIPKANVDLKFIKSVQAYTGMPGYGDPDREVPKGSRQEANEVLYQDAGTAMNIGTNKLQNIWVSVKVPAGTAAGSYTGTVTVTAKELAEPLTFTYTLKVADAELPDATKFKDGFDMELWQNPYRIAEYYDVTPFSEEHFEILKSHMGLYKNAGGHAITTTIVEEAWAGQTYGEGTVKFPSMVKWTKKADGKWSFDYTDFDKWVTFNKDVMKIGDKIVCYSIAPWTNSVVYYDEATKTTVKKRLTPGSEEWTTIWTAFLNDLADHLYEKGWFNDAYIGIDERGFNKAAFDLIDSIKRGIPTPLKLKSAGAMDGFVEKKDLAMRVDDLNVGSIAVKAHPQQFEEIRQAREDAGLRTTIYTCTGHKPGNFSLSAPGESYWTMMYSYSVGGEGYLRWAYDSWVENPLEDTTHNAFEAGDCFLVFPDDSEAKVTKSSTRFEKMAEGVRDVNKLIKMKSDVPSMAAKVDALMDSVKPTYASSAYYLTDAGKQELASDMNTIKTKIAELTEEYVALKKAGVTEVDSVSINGEKEVELQEGGTTQLEVTVLPENVLNNTVTWSTDNPAVAVVKDGAVTAKGSGRAVITVTSNQNEEKKDSVTIVVKEAEVEEGAQVSYYSFDDVKGQKLEDEWGKRDGTLDASCTTEAGKSGKALNVTQDGKGAVITQTAGDLNDKDWTISYWVKTTSEFNKEISVLEDSTKAFSFSLKMAADRVSGFRVGNNGGDVLSYQYDFEKDKWYHITWVQDKDQGLAMYVNGTRVGDINAWTKNNPIKTPADVIGGTGFTGLIDEVKVYNRVLNESEILSAMKVKGLNIADTNPTVNIGETYQITTNLITDAEDKTITYVSNKPEIASVNEDGLVTANKKGKAVITVTGGGYTEKVTVNCKKVLYANSRIPQYELADKYLKDIEKAPNTPRQYLGQPDMVQTKTGRLITAYPTGHGHGPIIMQISDDEGETWTEKKDIPASFATCQETPTLYTLDMGNGKERIMLISACPNWDLQRGGWDTAYSDDDGETWTEYKNHWPSFDGAEKKHTIVAMASLVQLKDEQGNYIQKWMGVFHDYGYVNFKSYLTFDEDGNEQWSEPERYLADYRSIESKYGICEVGMFRSPDGKRIMALARSDKKPNLSVMFYSDDEGKTWSKPEEMQGSLAGERHKAVYDPISGRLLITFREIVYKDGKLDNNWMAGDWVAWVGTYEDLLEQNEGEYRILIEEDWAMNAKSGDTGYAGILVLDDGTFIMDSYGHFDEEFSKNAFESGNYNVRTDLCYIKQAKFKLGEIENENDLIDRSALEAKINEVKDTSAEGYTDTSYAAFAKALTDAQTVFADYSAQQIQIDEALKVLTSAFEGLEERPVEPEKPTVEKVEIKANPAKTEYKEGEKFDPAGLVLTVKYNKGEDKEVAYSDATKADFAFNPSLDTALTEGVSKVDVTYAGKTVEIGIEVKADTPVEPETPTVDKVEIKANPAKTEYKEGEKFDPKGLVLTVTMSDGTTKVVAYGPETAKDFSFNPSLNTKLTADTKKVTVTYGGQSADVAVSVKADPSEDKKPVDPDKKPNTEKPDKGGAVQTGDNFNVTLLIGLVVLAGVTAGGTALTIFKRNKRK